MNLEQSGNSGYEQTGEVNLTPFFPAFFAKHFIEAGALAWPNGFDLSAESLYRKLHDAGELHRNAAAA